MTLPGLNTDMRETILAELSAAGPDSRGDLFGPLHTKAFALMATDLWHRFWDTLNAQAEKGQTAGSTLKASSTLSSVLHDSKETKYFAEYLRLQLAEENILFWLEANDHRLLFSKCCQGFK